MTGQSALGARDAGQFGIAASRQPDAWRDVCRDSGQRAATQREPLAGAYSARAITQIVRSLAAAQQQEDDDRYD